MYAVVCDVGEHVLKTKAGQDFSVLACPPVVELPGIEPATEIALSCGNAEFDDAKQRKQREMTCGYAKGVDGINTVPAAATISRRDRSERHSGALTLTLDTAPQHYLSASIARDRSC